VPDHETVREAKERSAPAGAVVYEAIRQEGEDELQRTTSALAWSGLAAGLSMGFCFATEALIHAALPDTIWRPLIAKLGYTTGFLIVVLGRQQLFTENTLTVILPLLRRRDRVMLLNVLRLWAAVLAANVAGAAIFAAVIAHAPVFDPAVRQALDSIAPESMAHPFWTIVVRGVFAGWLIALMVWLLPFAESARVWVIIIVTYIVGLANFSHVIAGSVDALYLVAAGRVGVLAFIFGFLVPTLVGNVIGGVSLVAALAHAQFVAGVEASKL